MSFCLIKDNTSFLMIVHRAKQWQMCRTLFRIIAKLVYWSCLFLYKRIVCLPKNIFFKKHKFPFMGFVFCNTFLTNSNTDWRKCELLEWCLFTVFYCFLVGKFFPSGNLTFLNRSANLSKHRLKKNISSFIPRNLMAFIFSLGEYSEFSFFWNMATFFLVSFSMVIAGSFGMACREWFYFIETYCYSFCWCRNCPDSLGSLANSSWILYQYWLCCWKSYFAIWWRRNSARNRDIPSSKHLRIFLSSYFFSRRDSWK